ncbi:unnamed protein product [Urochloa humidicola]
MEKVVQGVVNDLIIRLISRLIHTYQEQENVEAQKDASYADQYPCFHCRSRAKIYHQRTDFAAAQDIHRSPSARLLLARQLRKQRY